MEAAVPRLWQEDPRPGPARKPGGLRARAEGLQAGAESRPERPRGAESPAVGCPAHRRAGWRPTEDQPEAVAQAGTKGWSAHRPAEIPGPADRPVEGATELLPGPAPGFPGRESEGLPNLSDFASDVAGAICLLAGLKPGRRDRAPQPGDGEQLIHIPGEGCKNGCRRLLTWPVFLTQLKGWGQGRHVKARRSCRRSSAQSWRSFTGRPAAARRHNYRPRLNWVIRSKNGSGPA